jgi:hypothetical protein
MGRVKDMLMDVEDFVYDFYTKEGELTEKPEVIVKLAVKEFGPSFGEYAKEVLEESSDMEPHWDWNKSVSQNLVGFEMTNDKIPF